ncbi:MAG TPA: PD-(D/E)XK nuclease-like domain-containing protein [Xanthobacteraceae bacterium]|nr:PD-(D/E)XK nuclease-like domain-containing protein [Xanthobacteraceae bacterium]
MNHNPTLTLIDQPGVHDISCDDYHADPCPAPSLSSSIAKLLIERSPWHAKFNHPRLNPDYEPSESDKFDLGSAFHTLFLGKGSDIEIIEASDWRTKDAKEAREAARKAGLTPLLRHQYVQAQAMVDAVRRQVDHHEEAARAFENGAPERTIIWREDNGVWCRARLDWMPHFGVAYPDLKSTGAAANPANWGRKVMFDTGCDIQDAFYRRGLKKLELADEHAYLLFVVAETEEPHAMATHRLTPAAAAMADRKVEHAINLFGLCSDRNWWPGYRRETAWHDPPPWHEQRWIEREDSGDCEAALAELAAFKPKPRTIEDKQAFEDADQRDAFGLLPVPPEERIV